MRYASSLLYGGMLVDATNANYQDYSRLLLRCPFCGEAVFFSAAKKRSKHTRLAPKSKAIVLVKECEVSPSFVHFSGLAEKCETKSRHIKQQDISRSITKGRNQRLKFFQQRFWQIVVGENHPIPLKESIRKANSYLSDEMINDMHSEMSEQILAEFKKLSNAYIKQFACELLMSAISDPAKMLRTESQTELSQAISWISTLELDLHLEIVAEAADFLKTKSASKILQNYLDCANTYNQLIVGENEILRLMNVTKTLQELSKDYKSLVTNTIYSMIAILAGTQWAIAMHD